MKCPPNNKAQFRFFEENMVKWMPSGGCRVVDAQTTGARFHSQRKTTAVFFG